MRERTIALALGDPNGIGPEIAVKAAVALGDDGPRVVLVGDHHVVAHYADGLPIEPVDPAELGARTTGALELVAVGAIAPGDFAPGCCNAASGRATIAYVETALALPWSDAVVAGPHNETAIAAAGISFSGYPGLVARLAGLPEDRVFVMLVGGGLRIVHATLHERLADALARLDTGLVADAGRAAHAALVEAGVRAPRIGLLAINPHAGENGLFGSEDDQINRPAVTLLRSEGIDAVGPGGADLMLPQRDCDAYVAMYHDQGHIPVKLLAGRDVAALSIGAGVTFASVGHGSAPDIAGRDRADPAPLIRTLRLIGGLVGAQREMATL